MAVGGAHHRDLDAHAAQPGDSFGPVTLDRGAPLEIETQLGEEIDRGIEPRIGVGERIGFCRRRDPGLGRQREKLLGRSQHRAVDQPCLPVGRRQLLGELEQRSGQPLDPDKVRADLRRLFASGRYRDLSVSGVTQGNGLVLVYSGTARYYVGRVEIAGVKQERLASLL